MIERARTCLALLALLGFLALAACGSSSSGGGGPDPGPGTEQPGGEDPGGEDPGGEDPGAEPEPEPEGDPILDLLIGTAGSYAGSWSDDTLGTSGTWTVDVEVDEAAGTLTATVDVVGLPFVPDPVVQTVDLEDVAGPWREALQEDGSFSFLAEQFLPFLGDSSVVVTGTLVDGVVMASFSAEVTITELPGFTSAGYEGSFEDGVLDMTFEVVSPAFGDLVGSVDLAPVP